MIPCNHFAGLSFLMRSDGLRPSHEEMKYPAVLMSAHQVEYCSLVIDFRLSSASRGFDTPESAIAVVSVIVSDFRFGSVNNFI